MFKVQGIDHIGLAVRDVQKSVEWYRELFGLERLYEDVWGNFPGVVGIGETSVAFFPTDDPDVPLPPGLPIHHLAFRVDRANFKAAHKTLQQKGIEFEFQDHKIVHSIYFYDLDGHLIELSTYDLSDSNKD
ncbi:MAG: VOC family protein [Anaerolineae bacterium]|nr:VOC family protein [Anaerolineae bacterium]MCI0607733.1 VOC family protein [Anaerolineae bacterium]